MTNPFTMKSWSPYVVGIGIGVLSWFAFGTADKHLAITLQYEHIAAMLEVMFAPGAAATNRYYAARAQAGLEPKIGWYLMLLAGVFVGALLSSWLSGDWTRTTVPPLWQWRFGNSAARRFGAAFAGGALMVLGARIAGGCTSGHGISGTLQLAVQSWTFIVLAFGAAVATAFLVFGKEGRDMFEVRVPCQLGARPSHRHCLRLPAAERPRRQIPDHPWPAAAQRLDHLQNHDHGDPDRVGGRLFPD
jgi:uncharacterized membrane protein YedE/YeeE